MCAQNTHTHTHTHTHIRMCDVLCLHPLVGVEGPPQSVSGLCAHALELVQTSLG